MRVLRISHSAVVDAWRDRERALRRLGHDVEVLSAAVWNEGGVEVPLAARTREPVTGVRTIGRHPALFVYDPRPLWRALGRTWDVIDIHEEPFALATAEVLVLRALRCQRAPFVLYSAQNLEKRYPLPFRWLESWALRHAAGASACNVEAARILARKGLRRAATVIPLGTDLEHFRRKADRVERLPKPGDLIRVGYVGRIEPHKGVDVLLDAIARDERLSLVVAGSGSGLTALRARVRTEALGARVDVVGNVAQENLPDFYRRLDVLAVPSLTTSSWAEQFGRVAMEAMACGTPVVASASGALPEVVGGAGRLVPEGDGEALAKALLEVGTDPVVAAELSARGLSRAAETSWARVAEQYESLYLRTRPPACRETQRERPVEIIVVAYGAADLLRRTLEPVRDQHVTVVDNSSSVEVEAVCADLGIEYVDAGRNGGFAAGVNEGLRRRRFADSDVLLLNPDAILEPSAIRALQTTLRAVPDLASVSPRLVGPGGVEDRTAWPYPTPWRAWLEAIGLGGWRLRDEYVVGAALLLRAEAIDEIGRLDERFFLYAEETDWAYRAGRLGWRHQLVGEVSAVHIGAGTSSDPLRRELHFHAGQERYYRKNFGALGWASVRLAQVLGSSARALTGGERGGRARIRLRLYARGPMRVERPFLPRAPVGEGRP